MPIILYWLDTLSEPDPTLRTYWPNTNAAYGTTNVKQGLPFPEHLVPGSMVVRKASLSQPGFSVALGRWFHFRPISALTEFVVNEVQALIRKQYFKRGTKRP